MTVKTRKVSERYLEVTFRRGKLVAAYLYLSREPGVKSQRTEKYSEGVLIDYDKHDRPIGIEITAPQQVLALLQELNRELASKQIRPVEPSELAPLLAA